MAIRDIRLRILGDAKSASDAFNQSERDAEGFFDGVSTKAVAFGTAIGDAITKGVSAAFDQLGDVISGAFDLEDVTANFEAALGSSAERAGELGEVASTVYRDAWGNSLEEVGDAVASLESAFGGLDTGVLEDLTGQAIAFADTFNTDVDSAVRSAEQLVNQGLAPSAQAALDLLTTGMQQIPTSVRDELLEATHEYGQFFGDLGLSGEEMIGGLIRASEDGVYGIDKFGDALKELTIRATDMSASSVAAYEAAGLSAEDMSARFLAGGEEANGAFNDLIDGLLAIEDPVEQANAAIALFGTPLEDLGTSEIPEFLEGLQNMDAGMGDVAGAAAAMADSVGGTNRAKIEAFRRKVMGRLSDAVAFVIEKLEEVWPTVRAGFGKVVKWAERNLLPLWEGFVEDVLPVVIDGLQTVGEAFQAAFKWVMDNKSIVLGALAGFGVAVLTVLVPAFISWAAAAAAAAVATLAAAAPFIALGVALAAAGGAVVYAYQRFETFRNIVDAVGRFFRDTVWPMMQTVFDGIKTAAEGIVDWFEDNWDTISGVVEGVFNGVRTFVTNVVVPIFTAITNAALGVVNWFRDHWDTISGVAGAIIDGGAEVIDWFTNLPTTLSTAFGDGFGWLKDKARDARNFISDRVTNIVDAIKGIATRAANLFGDGFGWLRTKALEVRNYIAERVTNIVDSIKGIATRAANLFGDGFGWLRDKARDVRNYISERVTNIVDAIKGIPGRAKTLFGNGFQWLKDQATSARDWIKTKVDDVVGFFTGMPSRIKTGISMAATALGNALGEIGGRIANGIRDGFKSAWNAVANRLNALIPNSIPITPGSVFGVSLPQVNIPLPDNPIPRLHTGGWAAGVPLGNREMLAILEEGEFVLSRSMIRDLASGTANPPGPVLSVGQIVVGDPRDVLPFRDELERAAFALKVANS